MTAEEQGDPDIVRAHIVRPGEVLLGLRRSNGQWSTFGGWAEPVESPADTLRRELLEELGIEVEEFRRLPDREATSDGRPAKIAVFAVTGWRGTPRNAAEHEHSAISWFGSQELRGLAMHDQARAEALALLA